jgi:hypothetical protein
MASKRVVLKTPEREFYIELNESSTADQVWLSLPLDAYVNVWGEEIYFEIPVAMALENGRKVMEVGEVAYWPQGQAFCVFFGRTPVSKGDKPEAYSPVTPIGRVLNDIDVLKEIGDRTRVSLERV